MFVSKKKYDELAASLASIQGAFDSLSVTFDNLYAVSAQLRNELDALKASRARSNENLKLGSAASAKARRYRKIAKDHKCVPSF